MVSVTSDQDSVENQPFQQIGSNIAKGTPPGVTVVTYSNKEGEQAFHGKLIITGVTRSTLYDNMAFIEATQHGISGLTVKDFVGRYGHRSLISELLEVSTSNLSRLFKRKKLDSSKSEMILDTTRVLERASDIFGSVEKANQWLDMKNPALGGQAPIELFKTFKGRELVEQALNKIEYGEFV